MNLGEMTALGATRIPTLNVPENGRLVAAWFVGVAALLLYVATLAPTVLWGDDAEYQRIASVGDLHAVPRGHYLWAWAARSFSRLPIGDPAYRANLVTALFAALGVTLVALCIREAGGAGFGMIVGASAVAVSHTFWLHAVRAEVYSLHCLLFLAAMLPFLRWLARPERGHLLLISVVIASAGLLNHFMTIIVLSGFVLTVMLCAPRPRWRSVGTATCGIALVIGLIFLLRAANVVEGGRLRDTIAAIRLTGVPPRKLAMTALYYVAQFPAVFALAVVGMKDLLKARASSGILLAVQVACTAAVVSVVQVKEYFVFHLPAYVCVGVLVGCGATAVTASQRFSRWAIVAALTIGPLAYYCAAAYAKTQAFPLVNTRPIDGRGAEFFLWPPKNGHLAARRFAKEGLEATERNAMIVADWTLAQPMLYLQEVEGVRADVRVLMAMPDLAFLERRSETQAIYCASLEPYYRPAELAASFAIEPAGPIYRLRRRTSSPN